MDKNDVSTIGKDFSLLELVKFVAAPVITRLLVSLLSTLDDSLFISRYCGQNALAAFSMCMPIYMFMDAIGMMQSAVATICSIKFGKKQNEEAKSDFTTMVFVGAFSGVIFTVALTFFRDEILKFLGLSEILMPHAESFFKVARFYMPFAMTNYIFNAFYVIAGKPKWSMYASALNMVLQFSLDWLFIVNFHMGMDGAAYANVIGHLAVCILGLVFYLNKNNEMHFTKPHNKVFSLYKEVFKYGRMQFFTSLALSIGSFISNNVQLAIGGETLVAAFTIVSNFTFMFMNSFFGLVGTLSPLVGYAYGEKNANKLAKICKQSCVLVLILIVILVIIIFTGRNVVLDLYLGNSSTGDIRSLAYKGLSIYPLALIFLGYNILVQEFANVVGRHKSSLFLSMMENLVFQNISVLLLPRIFGIDGIWFTFIVTEIASFVLTLIFVYKNKDVYGYGKSGVATFIYQ